MTDDTVGDWVAQTADAVQAVAQQREPDGVITCASGISPSGPIHLGNLREVMVPHLIADELLRRGLPCRHILSWDDFDRLRKVPAGMPSHFDVSIGRPLTAVPDPCGDHANWAEHFKAGFRDSLTELGVTVQEISQTDKYAAGDYSAQILRALSQREDIDRILGRYRTKGAMPADEDESNSDDGYYPFRPYCPDCGRDDTTVTAFDEGSKSLSYRCACGAVYDRAPLADVTGKLVWKVDWPMRWAYEQVTFEPAGVDHASPGSSFTVGSQIVREIYDAEPPYFVGYSFVGTSGAAKMSGSRGGAPTPADALRVLEPSLLRWLYARRKPNQSFTIAFGQEVNRTYDEWDSLTKRVREGTAKPIEAASQHRAARTTVSEPHATPRVLPFRVLASVADITAGDGAQVLRILRDLTAERPVADLDQVRPRLDCAQSWVAEHVPAEERTKVRQQADELLLTNLPGSDRHALKLLLDGLTDDWSLDGLTSLLYGVPKLQRGLPLDTPPTPELKAAQREWFILLYRLLVSAETGPRLPTLLLALGADRVRSLLSP